MAILARDPARLEATSQELERSGTRVLAIAVDAIGSPLHVGPVGDIEGSSIHIAVLELPAVNTPQFVQQFAAQRFGEAAQRVLGAAVRGLQRDGTVGQGRADLRWVRAPVAAGWRLCRAPPRLASRSVETAMNDVVQTRRAPAAADAATAAREPLRALLRRNSREGYSYLLNRHYCYVAPAPGTYPYPWFWDTCFHVIMLARLVECECEFAKRHLRSLVGMQEGDDYVGHMIFWRRALPHQQTDVTQARPSLRTIRPHMSAMIQPPLAAQALIELFRACGDRVSLGELYAKLRRQHECWRHTGTSTATG